MGPDCACHGQEVQAKRTVAVPELDPRNLCLERLVVLTSCPACQQQPLWSRACWVYSDEAWLIQAADWFRVLARLHVFAAGDTASRLVALFFQGALQSLHSRHQLPLPLCQARRCSTQPSVIYWPPSVECRAASTRRCA